MKDVQQILLFDGVCNLCNASVQFVLRRDKDEVFLFAPLQSPIAEKLLSSTSAKKDYITDLHSIVLIRKGQVYDESSAALYTAKELSGGWPLLYYLFIWWPKGIRDAIYRFVAKRRYKWFGKQNTCSLPDKNYQDRFL